MHKSKKYLYKVTSNFSLIFHTVIKSNLARSFCTYTKCNYARISKSTIDREPLSANVGVLDLYDDPIHTTNSAKDVDFFLAANQNEYTLMYRSNNDKRSIKEYFKGSKEPPVEGQEVRREYQWSCLWPLAECNSKVFTNRYLYRSYNSSAREHCLPGENLLLRLYPALFNSADYNPRWVKPSIPACRMPKYTHHIDLKNVPHPLGAS